MLCHLDSIKVVGASSQESQENHTVAYATDQDTTTVFRTQAKGVSAVFEIPPSKVTRVSVLNKNSFGNYVLGFQPVRNKTYSRGHNIQDKLLKRN